MIGVQFGITELGYPYSSELSDSINILKRTGSLASDEQYLTVTQAGEQEYQSLLTFTRNMEREPFIDGACSSLLALPIGTIRSALSEESGIKGALVLSQSRMLLNDNELSMLDEQFSALSSAIGVEVQDLLVPALVWLTFLSEVKTENSKEDHLA